MKVRVRCEGISPLLMNRVPDELLEQLRTKTTKPKVRDISQADEAFGKIYLDETKKPGIPVENLFSCLVNAGRMVKIDARRSMSTATSTLLPMFMSLEEQFLPFHGEPKHEIDLRRGRNPKDGVMVALVRPKFRSWSFDVTVEINDKLINVEHIRRLFDTAGTAMGLGDFRPSCKGQFGRFKVTEWEVLPE